MILTCMQCGAVNEGHAQTCCFCDAQLGPTEEVPTVAGRSAPTEGNLAVEPNWRREVAHRLEAYRARRRRLHPDDSQAALPFNGTGASIPEPPRERAELPTPARATALGRGRRRDVERVEIAVTQPELDFPGAQDHRSGPWPRGACGTGPLFPVAELAERRRAGLLDVAFLLLSYAGFLALFASLGGRFTFGKFDALVYAATLALFYAQYFALFTLFGGATPGMLLRGLRVASFDGGEPTSRQLLWRSFGYLVSGGTVLLGFLWALWDEDHLTWQDRISQTYLTHAERPGESEPRDAPRDMHGLVQK